MPPNELTRFKKGHGYSWPQMAEIFQVKERTMQDYGYGKTPIPGPVNLLLYIFSTGQVPALAAERRARGRKGSGGFDEACED